MPGITPRRKQRHHGCVGLQSVSYRADVKPGRWFRVAGSPAWF